jgi:hypothetical protein
MDEFSSPDRQSFQLANRNASLYQANPATTPIVEKG